MLRITVEILGSVSGRRRVLGVLDICNVSPEGVGDDVPRGDYEGHLYRKGTCDPTRWVRNGVVSRKARVENYPRLAYPVWRLVLKMLLAMYPEERAERAARRRIGGHQPRATGKPRGEPPHQGSGGMKP